MTPIGTLLHDTAHDLGMIQNSIWLYKYKKKEGELKEADLEECFEKLLKAKQNIQDRLDRFYIEHKNKFANNA